MKKKPIFLWCVPRSSSTAFERIFIERGDVKVFHEPYSVSYYFSNKRRSNRYSSTEVKPEYSYERVTQEIFSEEETVFAKDMAFHLSNFCFSDILKQSSNTFLIREPIAALNSQYKLMPDFNLEESGYPMIRDLFFAVAEITGSPPFLFDSDDFRTSPESIVQKFCNSIELEFKPESLSWKKRDISHWSIWSKWHKVAEDSTGIIPLERPHKKNIPASDHVKYIAEKVMPIYEELKIFRVIPEN